MRMMLPRPPPIDKQMSVKHYFPATSVASGKMAGDSSGMNFMFLARPPYLAAELATVKVLFILCDSNCD